MNAIQLKGSVVTSFALNVTPMIGIIDQIDEVRAMIDNAIRPDDPIDEMSARNNHDPIIHTMEMLYNDAKQWGKLDLALVYGTSQIRRWNDSIWARQRDVA